MRRSFAGAVLLVLFMLATVGSAGAQPANGLYEGPDPPETEVLPVASVVRPVPPAATAAAPAAMPAPSPLARTGLGVMAGAATFLSLFGAGALLLAAGRRSAR
jgi:hypothetical protein